MFKHLFNLQKSKPEQERTDPEILLASLLIKAARIDNEYTNSEKMQIEKILKKKFNISDSKAKEIRLSGEELEIKTVDTVQITREIKKDVPFEKRQALAEDLWSIVLADEKRTDDENSFMRTCIKLIGLSDVESAIARKEAERRIES